ncbi:MAG: hypothetical protein ABUL61_05975, partial [Oleiharenicola lentus]
MIIPESELKAFLHNHQANPHGWLGMHPAKVKRTSGVIVRAFRRNAVACTVIDLDAKGRSKKSYPMELLAPEGFFEVFIPGKKLFRHQLRYETSWGDIHQIHNAYS